MRNAPLIVIGALILVGCAGPDVDAKVQATMTAVAPNRIGATREGQSDTSTSQTKPAPATATVATQAPTAPTKAVTVPNGMAGDTGDRVEQAQQGEQGTAAPNGLKRQTGTKKLLPPIVPTVEVANSASEKIKSAFTIDSKLCSDEQGPDCAKLRLGDDYLTTSTPAKGYLYSCVGKNPNAPGSNGNKLTWINFTDATWNFFTKLWLPLGTFKAETGTFKEMLLGDTRRIEINNFPVDGKIGDWPMTNYPVLTKIDGNPGVPAPSNSSFAYPASPLETASPTCVSQGAIGVTKNGVTIFNATDARGEDAIAHEIVDEFGGHPARTHYHYHFIPERLDSGSLSDGHSAIVGYIKDGFPIYGYKGIGESEMSNDDLDLCHGHKHGTLGYHYHATIEYPYTIGCYAGTPRNLNRAPN